jgi:(p)ppGpp synthase/HD superfamily hydrolase
MLVTKALNFSAIKHKGQQRKTTGLPYIIHPIIVAHLVAKYKANSKHIEELEAASLLHDTLEDTDTTYVELEREFGPLVASIVMELTSDEETIEKVGKNEYLKNKMIQMSKYAFILKLIDRLANILDNPTEEYVNDTVDMMQFLSENRSDLTKNQAAVIADIQTECLIFINKLYLQ